MDTGVSKDESFPSKSATCQPWTASMAPPSQAPPEALGLCHPDLASRITKDAERMYSQQASIVACGRTTLIPAAVVEEAIRVGGGHWKTGVANQGIRT